MPRIKLSIKIYFRKSLKSTSFLLFFKIQDCGYKDYGNFPQMGLNHILGSNVQAVCWTIFLLKYLWLAVENFQSSYINKDFLYL